MTIFQSDGYQHGPVLDTQDVFIAAEYKTVRHSSKFYISESPVQNSPNGMLSVRILDEGNQLRA